MTDPIVAAMQPRLDVAIRKSLDSGGAVCVDVSDLGDYVDLDAVMRGLPWTIDSVRASEGGMILCGSSPDKRPWCLSVRCRTPPGESDEFWKAHSPASSALPWPGVWDECWAYMQAFSRLPAPPPSAQRASDLALGDVPEDEK